eukprot:1138951-Rhodomonas_salina.2
MRHHGSSTRDGNSYSQLKGRGTLPIQIHRLGDPAFPFYPGYCPGTNAGSLRENWTRMPLRL